MLPIRLTNLWLHAFNSVEKLFSCKIQLKPKFTYVVETDWSIKTFLTECLHLFNRSCVFDPPNTTHQLYPLPSKNACLENVDWKSHLWAVSFFTSKSACRHLKALKSLFARTKRIPKRHHLVSWLHKNLLFFFFLLFHINICCIFSKVNQCFDRF